MPLDDKIDDNDNNVNSPLGILRKCKKTLLHLMACESMTKGIVSVKETKTTEEITKSYQFVYSRNASGVSLEFCGVEINTIRLDWYNTFTYVCCLNFLWHQAVNWVEVVLEIFVKEKKVTVN